jgi:hypothetical protein
MEVNECALQQSFDYPNEVSKTETKPLHDHISRRAQKRPLARPIAKSALRNYFVFLDTVISHSRHRHQQPFPTLVDQERDVKGCSLVLDRSEEP